LRRLNKRGCSVVWLSLKAGGLATGVRKGRKFLRK